MALVRSQVSGTVAAVHVRNMQDVHADTLAMTIKQPDGTAVEVVTGFKGVVNEVRVRAGSDVKPGTPLLMMTKFDENPVADGGGPTSSAARAATGYVPERVQTDFARAQQALGLAERARTPAGSLPALARPGQIGHLTLKNRVIMSPMNTNFSNTDGTITERYPSYIRERARGGVSMICIEGAYPDPSGKLAPYQMGVHNDDMLPGMRVLAGTCHDAGIPVIQQLQHSGRRSKSSFTGEQPWAPSPIPWREGFETPREVSTKEVEAMVEKFVAAAVRAKAAGYDGVDLHMAHGYVFSQFLSPLSNHRTDRYGGSPENRMRFHVDVVSGIRKATGPDFVITARLGVHEFIEGGVTFEDGLMAAQAIVDAGVQAICASRGSLSGTMPPPTQFIIQRERSSDAPKGYLVYLAERVKEAVPVPVISTGRLDDLEFANDMLSEGRLDFVMVARGLLADPELVSKSLAGRTGGILQCTFCNECLDCLWKQVPIACPENPRLGVEYQG